MKNFIYNSPLSLSMKIVIPNYGQFCLVVGNNGNVATAIPKEGDCLVFRE
jgi:hypothetical protein